MAVQTVRDDDVDLQRDRLLVERCQAGESHAFDLLYLRYFERLKRFCVRRLGDRDEAEDVAQEAFARAWKALPAFSGEKRFYPWLSVIAGNLCTDTLRKRSRNTPVTDDELDLAGASSLSPSNGDEERIFEAVDTDLALQALVRISPRHREVLIQRETKEWTYQQIADFHGVRITTVEALIWRARRSLKREFLSLSGSDSLAALGIVGLAWRKLRLRATSMRSRLHRYSASLNRKATLAHRTAGGASTAVAHALPAAFLPIAGAIAAAGTSMVMIFGGSGGQPSAGTTAASSLTSSALGPGAATSRYGSTSPFPGGWLSGHGAAIGSLAATVPPGLNSAGVPGVTATSTPPAISAVNGSVGPASAKVQARGTPSSSGLSQLFQQFGVPTSPSTAESVLGLSASLPPSMLSAAGTVSSAVGSTISTVAAGLSAVLSPVASTTTSSTVTLPAVTLTTPQVSLPPVTVPPVSAQPPPSAPPLSTPPVTSAPVPTASSASPTLTSPLATAPPTSATTFLPSPSVTVP